MNIFKSIWRLLGFHVHEWELWGEPEKARILIGFGNSIKGLIQYRKCRTCAKTQAREVELL